MQKFSSKFNVQLIAETFLKLGVEDIVISPGSRNGALTMQFVNDNRFNCYSIVDERCASYVAMGMAIKIQKPVVISCTSGSAAANYYPAITEAFYQNIPMIILTADRPSHFTDLFDGQTIRQENLFEKHCYFSTQLQEEESEDAITTNFLNIKKAVHEAIVCSGPVHINMPFSEPLYESVNKKLISFECVGSPKFKEVDVAWEKLRKEYDDIEKIMVLVGQQLPNPDLEKYINILSEYDNVIVLTETTSNLHGDNLIDNIDAVLMGISSKDELKPDLLITLGQRVISKKIKQFLRANKPKYHWHIDKFWYPDTYFVLSQKVELDATSFLETFLDNFSSKVSDYNQNWLHIKNKSIGFQYTLMREIPWSDLKVFEYIISNYPKDYNIHYSNSSVIRYSQLFKHSESNPVYCNRGTSGIDGSTSTAIGFAMKSDIPVVFVTGDISFFYDSNALWNNYIPSNFRIILINNGGGNIFKIIPGPSNTNALEQFFETQHHLTGKYLAEMYGFIYECVDDMAKLKQVYGRFYEKSERPKILEINTKTAANSETLHKLIEVFQN